MWNSHDSLVFPAFNVLPAVNHPALVVEGSWDNLTMKITKKWNSNENGKKKKKEKKVTKKIKKKKK